MGKTEILAELPQLSPEDRVEIRARLDELARDARAGAAPERSRDAHVVTPRLADPGRAGDFRKHVTELGGDAAV